MTLYKIEWKNSAKKELKKLEKSTISKIISTVESLSSEPHPIGSRKLQGSEHLYRVRVGDYTLTFQKNLVKNRFTALFTGSTKSRRFRRGSILAFPKTQTLRV